MVLKVLSEEKDAEIVSAEKLSQKTGLDFNELNPVAEYLYNNNAVERNFKLGKDNFDFGWIMIKPEGRLKYEEMIEEKGIDKINFSDKHIQSYPLGSPYGFTQNDWDYVRQRKIDYQIIYIVFGYQFKSEIYDNDLLIRNLKEKFEKTFVSVKEQLNKYSHRLDFKPLAAGLGEHQFNQIARDIIGSDIAIFETSDLNPNVMIELGVALTWGISVVPIKRFDKPRPPSDISGQTWLEYDNNADYFSDKDIDNKLCDLFNRVINNKYNYIK